MNLLVTNEPEESTVEARTDAIAAPGGHPQPGRKSPKPDREPALTSLFRVVWRWHFYAGIIVAPVLVVVALTGGIYVFKAEVHDYVHRDILFATVTDSRVPYSRQVEAALAGHPDYRVTSVEVSQYEDRTTKVTLTPPPKPEGEESAEPRRRGRGGRGVPVYVDPYSGSVAGTLGGPDATSDFFRFVLDVHRRLFAGTTGRVIVELATCWTIVLLVTGLYLWWPRRREKVKGVWLPRLTGKLYVVLRDVHTLVGVYTLVVALLISCTGLVYTFVWGNAFLAVNDSFFKSDNAEGEGRRGREEGAVEPYVAPKFPLDEAVAIAVAKQPDDTVTVTLPTKPTEHYSISSGNDWDRGTYGRMLFTSYKIHRDTGEVLDQEFSTRQKFWWHGWTYPLHVGSVFGWTTKGIWLLTCAALVLLPITGLWMWWKRRPKGKTGFPRKPERANVPMWVWTSILLLSAFMPVFGASILLILLLELGVTFMRRRRAARVQPA